ncbi:MAG: HYExAFE family protein [Phycisphaerae bacterium]|nr:HYExAFE family protein [Phycisphaerae bacterium]
MLRRAKDLAKSPQKQGSRLAQRSVHYEAAFEDFLRSRAAPYVAVDEAKKALFGRASLKSFDFIVYSEAGPNLLVDVKGRKFPDAVPGARRGGQRAWENWVTRDDVESLIQWQGVFGVEFTPILTFAYWLQGPPERGPFEDVHVYRQKHYAFMAVSLERYLAIAKPRSRKWQTLSAPSATFAREARPFTEWM